MKTSIKDLKKRIRLAKRYKMEFLPTYYEQQIEIAKRDNKIKELKRKMKYGYSPNLKKEDLV